MACGGQLEPESRISLCRFRHGTVLEVLPHASADEIRRAYRRKIKQCHPDRVAWLAPEFLELAEIQTRALNAAYGEANRARRRGTEAQ
jgi:DnaJ-domain-containing protein 1